jgi:hypothetical protein
MTARSLLLALAASAPLAACNTAPYQPLPPSPYDQQRLASFFGDRVAGPPTKCISASPGMQIEAVGDKVVAKWGGRLWVNQVQGSCRMADSPSAFLATDMNSAGQYCANDTWKIVSNSGGMVMGVCELGPWVPYTR